MSTPLFRKPRASLLAAALSAAVLALGGCRDTADSAAAAPAASPTAAGAAPEAAPAAPSTAALPPLVAGMPASGAEALLTDAGWLPLRDREACLAGAGDAIGLCRSVFALASCADGACVLQYAHRDTARLLRLQVVAPAPDSEILGAVREWSLAQLTVAAPAGTCPAADFNGFLRAFAAEPAVRDRHTAPLVRVAEMVDLEEAGYREVQTLALREHYRDFALTLRDGRFHVVDSAGGVSPLPVEPEVRAEADGAYFVSLPGDVEGTSYRFERDGDCWRLTEDPEPAAS